MKCIVIQQYKLRGTKLVPTKENSLELDWKGYQALLAPSGSKNSFLVLRKVKVGSFVGLLSSPQNVPINFVYALAGVGDNAKPLLAQVPNFEERLLSVYKVLFVDFGTRVKY